MPLGEIAGEAVGALFRFVGHTMIDIVLDFVVRGLGYVICKQFSESVKPDSALTLSVGIAAWFAIFLVGSVIISFIQQTTVVDYCLDGGGKFYLENMRCIE